MSDLDEAYASLSTIECRGQCQDSCGSIGMSRAEQRRIEERHGRTLPLLAFFGKGHCPALTMFGRCGIYEDRPMVCRLWGLVPSMACPYGCVPEGGFMSERAGRAALARSREDIWNEE